MLGSVFDADDAVQETMVRAWQKGDQFEGRSSLRTWLYRIATNVCLDALAERKGRARPVEDGALCAVDDELVTRVRRHWLEPIPDARALPSDANPHDSVAECPAAVAPSRRAVLFGRVLQSVAVAFLTFDASMKVFQLQAAVEGTVQLGYPAASLLPLGLIQVAFLLLYIVPRTSILGAVLWTGYLGGAVATHVRMGIRS